MLRRKREWHFQRSERIDALADELSTAELVQNQQAVAVLETLENRSSGALSDDVLVLAARHYLRLRKESEGEEPDLDEVIRDVRYVLADRAPVARKV